MQCLDCEADAGITLVCMSCWDVRYERDGERAITVLTRDVRMKRPDFDVDGLMEKDRRAAEYAAWKAKKDKEKKRVRDNSRRAPGRRYG